MFTTLENIAQTHICTRSVAGVKVRWVGYVFSLLSTILMRTRNARPYGLNVIVYNSALF